MPSALSAVAVWPVILAAGVSVRSTSVKWMVPPAALSSVAEPVVLICSVTAPVSVLSSAAITGASLSGQTS